MAETVRIRVLFNNLPAVQRMANEQIKEALDAIALDGERDVKQSFGTSPSAPGDPPGVDTGALRNSIHTEAPRDFTRLIADGVEYGVYLEFGTSRMAPRPFMQPMADRLSSRIPSFFDRFLD